VAVRPVDRDELIDAIGGFMRRVGVEEAILYGSRARGDNLRTSDVDLILISPRFEGLRPHRRLADLQEQWDPAMPFLEVLAYTPEEFERARHGLGIERIADEEGLRLRLSDAGEAIAVSTAGPGAPGGKPMLERSRCWLIETDTRRQMAQLAAEAGLHSQVILNARQAVELALKAAVVSLSEEQPPRTHSLRELLAQLEVEVPEEVQAAVRALDPFYAVTRYPTDLVPSPTSYYDEKDAGEALESMNVMLAWVKGTLLPEADESGSQPAG
jgi:uncharacterized protein